MSKQAQHEVQMAIANLKSRKAAVRQRAATTIREMWSPLRSCLGPPSLSATKEVYQALLQSQWPLVIELLTSLATGKAEPVEVRCAAIETIGLLQASECLPVLAELLQEDDRLVRLATLRALGWLGEASMVLVEQIVQLLVTDPYAGVRATAATTLAHIGPDLRTTVALLAALKDKKAHVRLAVIEALEKLGEVTAVEELARLYHADNEKGLYSQESVGQAAGKALIQILNWSNTTEQQVVAIVVNSRRQLALLQYSAPDGSPRYLFPGGRIAPDQSPRLAVTQWVKAQLGLETRDGRLVAQGWSLDRVSFCFRCYLQPQSKEDTETPTLKASDDKLLPVWLPVGQLPEQSVYPAELKNLVVRGTLQRHWPDDVHYFEDR